MKKIFTLIASLMMVLSMNAATKTIYCKMSQSWWKNSGASVGAYMWTDNGASLSWPGVKMTPVTGETDLWSVEVDTDKYKKIIFTRLDGAGTNFWNAQTNDLTVPTDANNLYTITQSSDAWADQGKKCTGSWGTYTPPAVVVIPDRYLTGTLAGGWNANDVLMTYDEANEIYTHTFTSVAADTEHKLKVTDGTWSNSWGGNNVSPAIDGVTADGDGNAVFTLSTAGDVTITFDGSNIQLTTTGAIKVAPKFDYYAVGTFNGWTNPDPAHGMTLDGEVYKATVTLAAGENLVKVTNGTWTDAKGFSAMGAEYNEVSAGASEDNIMVTLAAGKDIVVVYNATTKKVTFEGLTEKAPAPTFDYYITGSFNGNNPKKAENGMTLDGTVYKATVTLAEGENTLKVTDGTWDNTWGANELGAAYEEVSNPNDYNNIKITLAAEKEITVIFDATGEGKITFANLTEKAPAEPVTVYFINSGEWAEVACYYWGGIEASTWPGAEMTANGEVYEAEGWNVYAITFPGDNTKCIFTDNKAEGATQTADLEVHDGQYYCYANGIWYERLADVDLLDTRVYLKGDMNEWCATEGWCDMFRKETVDGTVVYREVYLEAATTYEFKIEDAGTWLSNEGEMTKENCTGWTFETDKDNCKITTEYAGDYTFVWDMTTKKLSVEYPNPLANPEVMDLTVTGMVFDEDARSFSGTDNTYGIAFNLVIGEQLEYGVFSLDASSTVNFGVTPFTDVTGMIAPDMDYFASATAQVYGFLGGAYYQLNVQMSADGAAGVPVEILDGTASVDGAGELTISGNWDGDDVYVVAPGFNGVTYDCDEVWFYVGGTTWETASIIAFGPASIEVDGSTVLVSGTVMSGMTGAQYELFVFGELPVEETPDYTRTVAQNQWGTICLPNASSSFTGATFYEVSSLDPAKGLWLDQLKDGDQLVAGKPYIFYATATEITVTYTDAEPVENLVAGANGLTGTFTDIAAGGVLVGNYIIAENKVWVAGESATLPANRAYIANTVPTTEQPKLPGRRRVCMGENATTGLDQIVAPEGQAVKAIENGQLIIIRDGVKYNVQGQKL